jgi:hypothetical protein
MMKPSGSRILFIAGLAIVSLLILILGITFLVWGWPPSFEVKGFWWN